MPHHIFSWNTSRCTTPAQTGNNLGKHSIPSLNLNITWHCFLGVAGGDPAHCLQGRTVMWLWLQERPNPHHGNKDYAGCMSVPRVMYLHKDHLHQQPIPELEQLHLGKGWEVQNTQLPPWDPL